MLLFNDNGMCPHTVVEVELFPPSCPPHCRLPFYLNKSVTSEFITKTTHPSDTLEHIAVFDIHPFRWMVVTMMTARAFAFTFHFCSSMALCRNTRITAIVSLTSRSNARNLRLSVYKAMAKAPERTYTTISKNMMSR